MKKSHLKTRHALLMSCISLMTCFAMLVGATFAWFTDSVTSGVNRIVAGNLDVELYHVNSETASDASEDSKKVDNQTQLFRASIEGNKKLWEPGAMAYETFTVKNVGSLALKYQMAFNKVGNNFVMEKDSNDVYQNTGRSLLDVLRVGVIDGALAGGANRSTVAGQVTAWTTLKDFNNVFAGNQSLAPGANGEPFTVVLYWPSDTESVSALTGGTLKDNDYNLQNGKYASDASAATVGELYIDLGITLIATQDTVEADSFNNQYDANSTYPSAAISDASGNAVAVNVTSNAVATKLTFDSGALTGNSPAELTAGEIATAKVAQNTGLTLKDSSGTAATLTSNDNVDLQLSVTSTSNTGNIQVATGESVQAFDVDMIAIVTTTTGVGDATMSTTNNYKVSTTVQPVIATLKVGVVDLTNFYHNGKPMTLVASATEVDKNNEYYYDRSAGVITFATNSFSPFAATYKYAGGLGTAAKPYVIDGVKMWKALVDATKDDTTYAATTGKYFSVTSDIDVSSYSERMNIHYFAGHIDFNNHELSGYNARNIVPGDINDDGLAAVFSMIKGDVEIANLKFVTSGVGSDASNVVAVSVTGVSYYNAVDVTFKNVDTYGTVTGATGNNNSLLLAYVFMASCKVTCVDCDNYATIVGSGYRSAFIGNMGNPSSYNTNVATVVTFTNCHNYGTIVSTGEKASMLLSNDGYPSQDVTVTITNCSNKGAIISKNASNLKVNDAGNGLTKYKFTGNVTGNPVQTLTTTTLETNNGNFVLNPTNGAVRYELNFSFTARSHAGGNVGYLIPIEASESLPTNIFVGEWLTKEEAVATKVDVVNHGTYYTCGNNYVFYEDDAQFEYGRQVLATFIAYGENNEMLSIATYTYPWVNK